MDQAIHRIVGTNGKHYPIFRLTEAEREILVEVVHRLRHEQQMSIHAIRDWLSERGAPISHGTVANISPSSVRSAQTATTLAGSRPLLHRERGAADRCGGDVGRGGHRGRGGALRCRTSGGVAWYAGHRGDNLGAITPK
jgi:hypothetical protein